MSKEVRNLIVLFLLALVAWIVLYTVYMFVKFVALYIVLPALVVGGLGYFVWKVVK